MLTKSFSTLAIGNFPSMGEQVTASVVRVMQKLWAPTVEETREEISIPGLHYRRDAVSKCFCIHD